MELIRDLLIFIAVMFALCIVLIVVVSKLPGDNPLKHMLTALSYRVGATLAAGAVAFDPQRLDAGLVLDERVVVAVPRSLAARPAPP